MLHCYEFLTFVWLLKMIKWWHKKIEIQKNYRLKNALAIFLPPFFIRLLLNLIIWLFERPTRAYARTHTIWWIPYCLNFYCDSTLHGVKYACLLFLRRQSKLVDFITATSYFYHTFYDYDSIYKNIIRIIRIVWKKVIKIGLRAIHTHARSLAQPHISFIFRRAKSDEII